MTTYIVRRLLQSILVLLLVTLLVFFVMRLLPGDPIIIYVAQNASTMAMNPEQIDYLRHQFGLDRPIFVQYASWVGKIFSGEISGNRYIITNKVGVLMGERFPVTVHIGIVP